MNWEAADSIARAVLYEGHLLYPYRASALKNRRRPLFGTIEPAGSDGLLGQGLVEGTPETSIAAKLRFLQDLPEGTLEREVEIEATPLSALTESGLRRDFQFAPVEGRLSLSAESLDARRWKLTLRLENCSRENVPAAALVSCHVLLGARDGGFLSSTDGELTSCGLWPALVGSPPERSLLLLSPIILPDYARVAPESPRDLFDLGEIDEILSLRILTLSEAEKEEIRRGDGRGRGLLDCTEGITPEELLALHGRASGGAPSFPKAGDQVRLRPKGRADIMDLALEGKEATVLSVEEDLEGRRYVAVTVKDDPGSDLGEAGFLGHRFFFRPEEVEPL